MVGLGADVNEVWYTMATAFYFSAEYASLGRDDAGFVTDLYNTFFNRAPDAGGLSYWTGQIAAGLPRQIVLVGFMFSPEFTGFSQGIFGIQPDFVPRGFLGQLALPLESLRRLVSRS